MFLRYDRSERGGSAVDQVRNSKTFVLVHGAWHGGWCWRQVASILRARGHTVLTPTQTGLGERSHLLGPSIDLDVFITDIINVLKWEDLSDVVLVGHSFGGSVVSGAADRMPERIRHLVYLDAVVLEDGQSAFSKLPEEIVRERTNAAFESSAGLSIPPPPPAAFGITDPLQTEFIARRLTPHPFNTFAAALKLANTVGNNLPASYIVCTDPVYIPLETTRNWVKATGWNTLELSAGHDAMVIAPTQLAELLDRDAP